MTSSQAVADARAALEAESGGRVWTVPEIAVAGLEAQSELYRAMRLGRLRFTRAAGCKARVLVRDADLRTYLEEAAPRRRTRACPAE
jgi:hypothetical protein